MPLILMFLSVCLFAFTPASAASTGTLMDPPSVKIGILQQTLILGGQPYTVNLQTVFDNGGESLTFSASSNNPGVASPSISGNTLTVTPVSVGVASVNVTATNVDGSAEVNFNVIVLLGAANQPPVVANPIADRVLQAGGSSVNINLSNVFSDPDDATLTYSAQVNMPAIVTASVAGSTLTLTPQTPGQAMVTVTATDPDNASVQDQFMVTVNPPGNRPPVVADPLDDIASIVAGSGAVSIPLTGVFSDPDNDPLTYTVASNNQDVASVVLSNPNTLAVTPLTSGQAEITVTARDGRGGSVDDRFRVTVVDPPNQPPVVQNPLDDLSITVGQAPATVDISTVFSDPDGDALTYDAKSNNNSVATADVQGNLVTVQPVSVGKATITVTATDPDDANVEETFVVTVDPAPNRPPQIAKPIPDTTVQPGSSGLNFDLSTVFTDPDGDALTYTATSNNEAVATASVSQNTLNVQLLTPGNATITVTANDGKGGTAEDQFTITRPNAPPEVIQSVGDRQMQLGGDSLVIRLNTVFSDADGDRLAYAVRPISAAIAFAYLQNDQLIVRPLALGTTDIILTADDGRGGSIEDRFTVTVNEKPNSPPVVTSPAADIEMQEGGNRVDVNLANVFNDPDDDPLTYTATSGSSAIASVSLSGSTLSIVPVSAGQTVITVTASDGRGGQVQDQFTVLVRQRPNRSPEVRDRIEDQQLAAGGDPFVHDLTDVFRDPDGDPLDYTVASSNPGVADASLSGDDLTVTPLSVGVTEITVTATDDEGASVTDRFTVTVTEQPNQAPVVVRAIGNRQLQARGTPLEINLTTHFSDPDGDTLTYTHQSDDTDIVMVVLNGTVLIVTPLSEGQADLTITASDGRGGTAQDQFTVTINQQPNSSPVVDLELEDQTLQEGDPVREIDLDPVFSDPDDDPLVYMAESSSLDVVEVQISGSKLLLQAVSAGATSVSVTASDGRGGTVEEEFTVIVNQRPNVAPTVVSSVGERQVQVGDAAITLDLNTVFSDPDGDVLTYSVQSSAPGIATARIESNVLTIDALTGGRASITVTADDGRGGEAEEQFDVVVAAQAVQVVISEQDELEEAPTGTDVPVRVQVQNAPEGATVSLSYRRGGEASFTLLPMTLNGGFYEASIPAEALTPMGVQWYVVVEDANGVTSETARFDLQVAHEGLSIEQKGGTETNAYRLISVPIELSNRSARAILEDDLGPYNAEQWRFFAHTGGENFTEGPANLSFERGKSYWLLTRDDRTITTGGGLSAPLETFSISLDEACTFIANPFAFDVPFENLSLEGGGAVKLWAYNGSWVRHTSALEPSKGYVICDPGADRLDISPFPVEGAAKKATTAVEYDWAIRIRARSGAAADDVNEAAVSPLADLGLDELDWPEPPVIGKYVSLSFVSDGGDHRRGLSADVRSSKEEAHTWTIEVRSNIEDRIDLLFDGIEQIPPTWEAWLVDDLLPVRQDLRQEKTYSFAGAGEANPRRLRLVVGEPGHLALDDGPVPTRFEVDQNFPNPFSQITSIRYRLPEESRVTVEVFDLLGRKVVTFVQDQLQPAGHHAITWDGRDASGKPLAAGNYVCRVRTEKQSITRIVTRLP